VGVSRPLHLRWSALALVAGGGAAGTLARYAIGVAVPPWRGLPVAVFTINVVGAFGLGLLLAVLARGGPDAGIRRRLRLLLGTGVLGGFTTYSTFAVGADGLFVAAHPWQGALYAVATVVVGAAASLAGIALGTRRTGGA